MEDAGKAAAKEISAALKAAKEAIKQKEFKEALKHCKSVIKIDKTNYHALVFIGVCAKELEQYGQSQAAYRKAIEQNPDQLLAWQGLCSLYEATEKEEWKEDLVKTYEKLIAANKTDITKWRELLNKIISLQLSLGMASDALTYLKDLEGTSPEPSEHLLFYWQKTLSLLKVKFQPGDYDTELENQIENAFQSTMEYNRILDKDLVEPQEQHLQFLFDCLKGITSVEKAVIFEQEITEKAKALLELAPSNQNSLKIVCRILLEKSDGDLADETLSFIKKLQNVDPDSRLCKVGLACIAVQEKRWFDALDLLKTVQAFSKKDDYFPLQWFLHAKIRLFLHDINLAMENITKGMDSVSNCVTILGRDLFDKAFRIAMACCHIEQRNYSQVIELMSELLSSDPHNIDALCKLGEAYALLKDNIKATEISNKILELQPNSHNAFAIKARISINEEKFYDAELRIQEAIELCDSESNYHLLLGIVCWYLKKKDPQYAKRSYASLLKAAKFDPYNSEIFEKLGKYYQEYALDLKKAQKCYHKAFSLNKFNENAVMSLGEVSMDLGDEETAVDAYQAATTNFGSGRVKLAWLRLGMLLTKRENPEKAVTCFQSALRADPKDRDCWECLGDAYIARGSHIAALKAFSRAAEIDPSSVYCRYKIGSIKQALCVYTEAIQVYKELLIEQPDYIPALKGMAECHLKLEMDSLMNDMNGRAIDHAAEVLSTIARSFEIRQDLCCFWKIAGDCCFALHLLPDEKISLRIPPTILRVCGMTCMSNETAKKADVLDLCRRCYAAVVKLDGKSSSSWYDLAISTFHFGTIFTGEEGQNSVQRSIQFAKKAVSLAPHSYKMWNLLGLIAGCSDIANPELSQHAFIKALNIEPQNAEVWTNLGALYLKYNKVEAAHEAFKKAQDADPSYTAAWIGQASIAELIADSDAMDLFRHSSELGSHTESFLGYAKWVCFALKDSYKKQTFDSRVNSLLISENLTKAVVNSSVCARKYTERNPKNPCAWNFLGILLEHEKLFNQSRNAFERANNTLSLSKDNNETTNMVISNLARVLRSCGQFTASIDTYLRLQSLTKVDDICGLALSYFLSGQLEKSIQAYEQALTLCEDDRDRSDILAAMGMVGFAMDKIDMTKTLLFKSSQTGSPSEQGLMALASFGLLSRDHTLTNAALVEIQKHPKFSTEVVQNDFCFLKSAMHLLQGDIAVAKNCIQKAVIRFPYIARQWNNIAKFLYQRSPNLSLEISGRCAMISSLLKQSSISSMLISAASVGSKSFAFKFTTHSSHTSSILAAQKAVHSNPGQPEAWALLSAATFGVDIRKTCQSVASLSVSLSRLALQKAEENLTNLQEALKTTTGQQLTPKIPVAVNLRVWAIKHLICCYVKEGTLDIAILLADNAMTQYEENPEVHKELLFLKIVIEILEKTSVGNDVEGLLIAAKEICDSDGESVWKYQVLAELYLRLGFPLVSEFFIRQCIQLSSQQDSTTSRFSSLARLALISIQCYSKDKNERWITLAKEALTEASKFDNYKEVTDILRISLFHIQGDTKGVKRILSRLQNNGKSEIDEIINLWTKLYTEEEKKIDKDLYDVQNWN